VRILSGVFEGVTTGTPIALHDRQRRPALEGLRQYRPTSFGPAMPTSPTI
jgi:chorismate synthase